MGTFNFDFFLKSRLISFRFGYRYDWIFYDTHEIHSFFVVFTLSDYTLLDRRYKLHLINLLNLRSELLCMKQSLFQVKTKRNFSWRSSRTSRSCFRAHRRWFRACWLIGLRLFCSFWRKISLNPTFEIIDDVIEASIFAENIHHSFQERLVRLNLQLIFPMV